MESLSIFNLFNCVQTCRPKQGNIYGGTFVAWFQGEISELFERGESDKGENMTADINDVP